MGHGIGSSQIPKRHLRAKKNQKAGNEKVVAVLHTPEAIEVSLSNGMLVSIEPGPLTMAMKVYPPLGVLFVQQTKAVFVARLSDQLL